MLDLKISSLRLNLSLVGSKVLKKNKKAELEDDIDELEDEIFDENEKKGLKNMELDKNIEKARKNVTTLKKSFEKADNIFRDSCDSTEMVFKYTKKEKKIKKVLKKLKRNLEIFVILPKWKKMMVNEKSKESQSKESQ